eukprot:10868446-Prorocentrum_lima.AAC.1
MAALKGCQVIFWQFITSPLLLLLLLACQHSVHQPLALLLVLLRQPEARADHPHDAVATGGDGIAAASRAARVFGGLRNVGHLRNGPTTNESNNR